MRCRSQRFPGGRGARRGGSAFDEIATKVPLRGKESGSLIAASNGPVVTLLLRAERRIFLPFQYHFPLGVST
jgi:hypothetical protein